MRPCKHVYKPCRKCRFNGGLWCPFCKHNYTCLFKAARD